MTMPWKVMAAVPLAAVFIAPTHSTVRFAVATPVISTLNPTVIVAGGATFRLTVQGSRFARDAYVTWNGSPRPTTFDQTSTLYADIPATDLLTPGTAQLSVVNPGAGGGTSNRVSFTIGNPVPTISSVAPTIVLLYGEPFTVTVTGTKFVPGAAVQWNGSARPTTFVSATRLTANIPASDLAFSYGYIGGVLRHPAARITVLNPTPLGGVSPQDSLTVAFHAPTVNVLLPSSRVAGQGAFTLQVGGSSFIRSAVVMINGVARPTTFVSPSNVVAAIPASDVASVGQPTVVVRVSAPNMPYRESPERSLSITAPPATVSIPARTSRIRRDTTGITLTGSNLASGIAATVGGQARTVTVVSPTQLRVALDTGDVALARDLPLAITLPAPAIGGSGTLSVVNGVPQLFSYTVSSILADGTGIVILARGGNLVPETIAFVNGVARATTLVNRTTVRTTLLFSDAKPGAPASLALFNPAPGGGRSNAMSWTGGP